MTEPAPPTPPAPRLAPRPASVAIDTLDPARDDEAAAILAACAGDGTLAGGYEILAEIRADPARAVLGLTVDGALIAVYATRKVGLTTEITQVAVKEGYRRQRYGRACLIDALRRAGRRPLVVETEAEGLRFYQSAGFKLVSRRPQAGGALRYRLGLHSPSHYGQRSSSAAAATGEGDRAATTEVS